MSALCGGRSSRHAQKEEELEQEHDVLENEVRELREALEKAESELPRLNSELSAVETRAANEARAADDAEKIKTELLQELQEQSALPSGSPLARISSNDFQAPQEAKDVPDGEYADGVMPLPPPPLSPRSRIHRIPAVEHHTLEANRLAEEIASHQSELAELKRGGRGQLQMLEAAEAVSMQVRSEVAELRESLTVAEEEGRQLALEHRQAEADEEPLRDWVQHVEAELKAARAENADLSSKLTAELARRNELQKDEADARPLRRAGVDIQQVCWLQEHERTSIARKAALAEEIAAQRFRRKQCLEEAKRYREEAAAEERLQDQSRRQKSAGRGRGSGRLSATAKTLTPSASSTTGYSGRFARLDPPKSTEFLRTAGRSRGVGACPAEPVATEPVVPKGWLPPAPSTHHSPAPSFVGNSQSPAPPLVEPPPAFGGFVAAAEASTAPVKEIGRSTRAPAIPRRRSDDDSDGGEDQRGQRLGYWDDMSDDDSGNQLA